MRHRLSLPILTHGEQKPPAQGHDLGDLGARQAGAVRGVGASTSGPCREELKPRLRPRWPWAAGRAPPLCSGTSTRQSWQPEGRGSSNVHQHMRRQGHAGLLRSPGKGRGTHAPATARRDRRTLGPRKAPGSEGCVLGGSVTSPGRANRRLRQQTGGCRGLEGRWVTASCVGTGSPSERWNVLELEVVVPHVTDLFTLTWLT